MYSSMNACRRHCRCFTLSLSAKSISAAYPACRLSSGKSRGALLHEMRDTLFEILSLETCHHLIHGDIKSFREWLKHSLVHLALDDGEPARAHCRSQFAGIFMHLLKKTFLGKDSIHH